MCGITGFTWEDKELLSHTIKKIRHRGPEKLKGHTSGGVSLGHARLKIIDLSEKSAQPMIDDEGNVLVFNGEIYNYQELREELEQKGNKFKSSGDTEVLLKAWSAWGRNCLEKLNGMFAFAILEPDKKTLTLVRDRFGIKPLYYAIHRSKETKENSLVFASELEAIRYVHKELGIPPVLSEEGLRDFLTLRFTLNQTMFQGIKKLKPGHLLTFDLSTTKYSEEEWYSLPIPDFRKADDIIKILPDLLQDSVRYRMISDVPVGFFLSGGIDSGLITALATKEKEKLGEASDTIRTFSVGFPEGSELTEAKFMAEHLGTKHTEVIVDPEKVNILDSIIRHVGEPVGQAALIPTYFVSERAKQDVTVVQAGEGADEIFGGYDRYQFQKYGRHLSKLAGLAPNLVKHPIYERLAGMAKKDEFEQHIHAFQLFEEGEVGGPAQDSSTYRKYFEGRSLLQKANRFDLQTIMPNDFFLKADRPPMMHALEERVPFMDHRVVELGLSAKDNDKIRMLTSKWILRKAFENNLPKEVAERKKRGYNTPMDSWFAEKGILREQLGAYLDHPAHKHYDIDKAKNILRNFKPEHDYKGNYFASQQLFSLLTFEIWYRQHFKQ